MSDISVMTEISDITAPPLHPAVERFVLHWGELGGQWGVNRSVAQIHALLYVSGQPLTAEAIAAQLGIARSNVSTSLKELLGWDLIRRVPVRGDRRDHYEAEADVWEMLLRIARGRKAREFDPALSALRTALADADKSRDIPPVTVERLRTMHDFAGTLDAWYAQMLTVPKAKLATLLRLGARIIKYIPGGKST
jgi:DNA-binding transcriptional regulator GbsR (MarR family)